MLAFSLLLFSSHQAFAIQLITHPGTEKTEISRSTARAIFSMRRLVWPDGAAIRVFVFPDKHKLHKAFAKQLLGVFPHQLRRAWDRKVFSGTGQAPDTVQSEAEMLEMIIRTPGAIGYISEDNRDESVQILQVE
ncbi:hypothetical protein DJ030_13135 [bacterium endosymbiont of Escarpia laminata]|nr:MAG: hypothetical protein DJ030_13135 [bacterium endosymbiont of Escarpia laminata]RLJ19248.1 MAG: hypothetical protein DJ031_09325 [bacterium endosymbiont of Escarpia laminata]